MPSPKPFGDSNRYQEVGVELTSFGEDEEDDEVDLFTAQRYLDIKAVTAVVDKFKINRKGYKGIVVYSIFVSLLFVVMFQQRDNANIGIEDRALRLPLQLLKPQTKVTTVTEFWAFFKGTIVPTLMQDNSWTATVDPSPTNAFKNKVEMGGSRAQLYSDIIGGIAISQTRSQLKPCSHTSFFFPPPHTGIHCYSHQLTDITTDPDLDFTGTVTGQDGKEKSLSMKIPYDEASQTYVTVIPTSASLTEVSDLISYFESGNLIGPATRSIEIRVPVYNGNTDVIGILSWKIDIDLAGHLAPRLVAAGVPYTLYDTHDDSWKMQLGLQLALLLWVFVMVRALWTAYLRTWPLPDFLAKRYPDSKSWPPGFMPATLAGRTHVIVPAILYGSILILAVLWSMLTYQYYTMHQETKFTPKRAVAFFGVQGHSVEEIVPNLKTFTKHILPTFTLIDSLHLMIDTYFYVAAFTIVMCIFRTFHYLDFQGKLNAITQTFRGGIGEFFHLMIVLNFVVIGFSFLGYLLFGSQVKAYLWISSAYVSTWMSCFGLFKMKEAQLKYYDATSGQMFDFLFKLVVEMLLLKMVIAIIFDSYKEAAIKTRKSSPTVLADMRRLWFHTKNALRGGDGYVTPDNVGKFMHNSHVRMTRSADGLLLERESIGETELLPLFKKAMKSEYPVSDGKLGVMCEWILEHYGRIRCEFKTTGVMSEHDINIVRKIFNGHDLDRSGTIGSKEFGQCLCELKHPLGNDINYVQASLAVVDVDKSGEIEWEEFLMFVASESGKSVPPKLLPEHMQKNQDKILAEYAKHKDKTLNDASDSIWDSTDAMSSSATKASSVSGTTPAAAPAKAASTAAPKAIEKLYKNMLAAIEDNGESLQVIKDMIVPPENELSKFM